MFSSFHFSAKEQSANQAHYVSTFTRCSGTLTLMGPKTHGSHKFLFQFWGYKQPFHGATSGEYQSVAVIGSIDATDCIEAHDKLDKNLLDPSVFTAARLTRIVEDWNKRAPNSTEINSFYKTKLKYQARGIYGSKRSGYMR